MLHRNIFSAARIYTLGDLPLKCAFMR
jgi:hypothetical protein